MSEPSTPKEEDVSPEVWAYVQNSKKRVEAERQRAEKAESQNAEKDAEISSLKKKSVEAQVPLQEVVCGVPVVLSILDSDNQKTPSTSDKYPELPLPPTEWTSFEEDMNEVFDLMENYTVTMEAMLRCYGKCDAVRQGMSPKQIIGGTSEQDTQNVLHKTMECAMQLLDYSGIFWDQLEVPDYQISSGLTIVARKTQKVLAMKTLKKAKQIVEDEEEDENKILNGLVPDETILVGNFAAQEMYDIFCVEIKGVKRSGMLEHGHELLDLYQSERKYVVNMVEQTHAYCVVKKHKYVIFSIYDYSWFLMREASGQVYISAAVPRANLLKTLCCFVLHVNNDPECVNMPIPAALGSSLRNFTDFHVELDLPVNIFLRAEPVATQVFGVFSGGTCFRSSISGHDCVVKVADATKQPRKAVSMKKETSMHALLKDLMGTDVAPLLWYGEMPFGRVGMVTRYSGNTLAELLAEGVLGTEERLKIKESLRESLDRIHARGVVHRDIRAENVVVDENLHPMFIDFGVSSTNVTEASIHADFSSLEDMFNNDY